MNSKKRIVLMITIIFALIAVIVGATFAWLNWQSANEQKTAVTFTVTPNFSCGADAGGHITSSDKMLAPTDCMDLQYAIQRTITTNVTNDGYNNVYMDLYLKVNSIGTYLSQSSNFKYALTTDSTSCTNGLVAAGTFQGATTNSQLNLIHYKEYPSTTNGLYYLYIWLDENETNPNTQNQSFDISISGTCIDQNPFIYTFNIYDDTDDIIVIGQTIPNNITQYQTPTFSNNSMYLKHILSNDVVTETYVEFVVTDAMAQSNNGMTAGTYALRGGDGGASYMVNKAILTTAFGSSNCNTINGGSVLHCNVPNLHGRVTSDGGASIYDDTGVGCSFDVETGGSICEVD